MYVLTWIDDGVSANAAYVSNSVEKLKERVKQEWESGDCDGELEEFVDTAYDGTIVFRFDNPSTGNNEIFAQIEIAEKI